MSDIVEVLRTMADNIDATRPEYDYSPAHKRIDDADINALREAADLIDALRKANAEVMATGIKSVRDVAELAIELRDTKRERDEASRDAERWKHKSQNAYELTKMRTVERDEARREVCAHEADTSEDQHAYAKLRGWQCFAHTEGALQ